MRSKELRVSTQSLIYLHFFTYLFDDLDDNLKRMQSQFFLHGNIFDIKFFGYLL